MLHLIVKLVVAIVGFSAHVALHSPTALAQVADAASPPRPTFDGYAKPLPLSTQSDSTKAMAAKSQPTNPNPNASKPSAPMKYDPVERPSKAMAAKVPPVNPSPDAKTLDADAPPAPSPNEIVVEAFADPDLNATGASSASVECLCPATDLADAEYDVKLTAELEALKAEVANVTAARDALEETLEWKEKRRLAIINETNTELNRLEELVERQKHQLKTKGDRYQAQRKDFLRVDAELRRMHADAVSSYVNVTNIKVDVQNSIARAFSKASNRIERRWGRKLRPMLQDAKRRLNRKVREAGPKVNALKRQIHQRWSQSTLVRPFIDSSREMAMAPARALYKQYEPAIEEAKDAVRLTALSTVEEGSKAALSYLEKEEKKQLERELARGKKSSVEKQMENKRRNRNRHDKRSQEPSRQEKYEPSIINLRARRFFKYTLTNSEKLVERGEELLPLAIVLSLTGSCVLGGLLFFLNAPITVIWAIAIVNFLRLWRGARCSKAKKA